jgi:two-component system NtrC family sensor kinase
MLRAGPTAPTMSRFRLSVATKIALCFLVVLLAFASVGVTSIVSLHRLGHDLGVVSEFYLPLTKALAQIESLHKNKERDTDRVLQDDRATQRIRVSNTRLYFGGMMQDHVRGAQAVLLKAQAIARPQDQAFFADMNRRLVNLSQRYDEYSDAAGRLYQALSPPEADETEIAKRLGEMRRIEALAGSEVSFLSTALETQIASRVEQVHHADVRAATVIIGLLLVALALGLLATVLSQQLLVPIRTLTEEVKGISRGDFARRVELRSNDEVGMLAQEFNAMAASLGERERQLSEQRERVLRSERLAAIGQVSAQITHEIRNPLSSIGLNAELLADELASARFAHEGQRAEAEALLSAIAREIDRLTEISEQYLAFARAPRAPPTPLDLGDLCYELVDFLTPELTAVGIQVQLELAPDLPRILGNEDQLRQALLNLVRNAKEAMAATGAAPDGNGAPARLLTLRATFHRADGLRIEVRDTGPGVPPEVRERVFDPFFSTKSTGTGLGLALSQRIAQEHGGSLRLDEDPAGATSGARFVMVLPASVALPATTPTHSNSDDPTEHLDHELRSQQRVS